MASEQKGPQINWVGATGAGLGSVTSAVFLSTTGAAGTWIGAGIGTFIITVGGAIYAYFLQRAKTGIEKTADKIKVPRDATARQESKQDTKSITFQRDPNQEARSDPPPESDQDKAKPSFKEVLRGIKWKRVAGLGIGLFALTMAIVFIFELATGRPVSSYTGGTSPDSTGTSLTGITDPARDSPEGFPEQQYEDVEQPPEVPLEEELQPMPEEAEPEEEVPAPPVEPAPEQLPEQPQAPLQEEPAEVPE